MDPIQAVAGEEIVEADQGDAPVPEAPAAAAQAAGDALVRPQKWLTASEAETIRARNYRTNRIAGKY